jgi:hypothetical protein
MIDPKSGRNAVLQLNMGEGKSSVIVPMVATALADGKKLARVVVLKPLAVQMFDLLIQRVSGLVNRRVFFFPFSRSVTVDGVCAQRLRDLFELCVRERGIWLAQPEHILSFKLMGIDCGYEDDVGDVSEQSIPISLNDNKCSGCASQMPRS